MKSFLKTSHILPNKEKKAGKLSYTFLQAYGIQLLRPWANEISSLFWGMLCTIDVYVWFLFCFLAATKQLEEHLFLSVCLTVRHPLLTMFPSSYHHEIFRSYYQRQRGCPCKRSRSYIKGQCHRGHNPTYPFLDCNSSLNSHMMMKWCIKLDAVYERCPIAFQGHPSNFKVTRLEKSPILIRIERFPTVTFVSIYWWLWNYASGLKQHRWAALLFFKVIC